MGTWGPAIFDDDDAADLRDEYRFILADTQSDAAATDEAAREYEARFDRLEDTTAFWLALALIQWKLGRLDPRVRDSALRIIDEGIDLAKWSDSPVLQKRAAALHKARATVASPSPPPKPVPKPLPMQLPGWEFSEVVGYRTANGRLVLLHHLNYHAWTVVAAKAPVVSVLNWFETHLPDECELGGLTYINHNGRPGGYHLLCLAMPPRKALSESQFVRIGHKKPVTRDEATSAVMGIGGHEGLTLDIALNKILYPYWHDPTIPPHLPKELPADHTEAQALLQYWKERLWG
jgi:hypothetical protein